MIPDLTERGRDLRERMDDPQCDPARLARTYAQFPVVNRVVSGWGRTYRRFLRPRLRRDRPTTLLDLGCGGGDVARNLARQARLDGLALEVLAVDPDPRALRFARSRPPVPGVRYRRASSSELVAEGARFDLVVSNHVLHHLDDDDRAAILADSAALASRLCVHSDIERSGTAYALFSVGTRPFFPGSFIREDGLLSIRRSYRAAELRRAIPPGWTVHRQAPFRLLLVRPAGPPADA